MSRATWFAAVGLGLITLVLAPVQVLGQRFLPGDQGPGPSPKQINEAIDRGVAYLKAVREDGGTWPYSGHELGMTALAALALFESEVPRDDPAIVEAEKYVLRRAENCDQTYDLGLAILFLSKLHPEDKGPVRDLIRNMGWRLAAGEQGGMWTYTVPTRPAFPMPIDERPAKNPILAAKPKDGPSQAAPSPLDERKQGPLNGGRQGVAEASGGVAGLNAVDRGNNPNGKNKKGADGVQPALPAERPKPAAGADAEPGVPEGPAKDEAKDEPRMRPAKKAEPKVAAKPARPNTKKRPQNQPFRVGMPPAAMLPPRGDHSNTQFGMLGVWVSGRFGYDTRVTMDHLEKHFPASQRADGCWGYNANGSVVNGPQAMTCVGLLGLYLAASQEKDDGLDALSRGLQLQNDPAYQRGLEAVTQHAKSINDRSEIYYLWSLERLCVALGKEDLDGLDWYKAGARVLLKNQNIDGSWTDNHWGGLPSTCLALLFLHRSNLATGIEERVRVPEYKPIAGLPYRVRQPEMDQPEPPADEPSPGKMAETGPAPQPPREVGEDAEGPSSAKAEAEGPAADSPETKKIAHESSDEVESPPTLERVNDPRASILMVAVLGVLLALPALMRRSP